MKKLNVKLPQGGSKRALHSGMYASALAVVVLAALINGAKCLGLELPQVQTVISGAGAAGISICKLLMKAGYHPLRPAGGHLGGPGGPERGQDGHGEGH